MFLLRLEQTINAFSDWLGKISAVLFIIMLFTVFYNVVARYLLNDVSIALQEMEWHLFAAMFMLGVPFTLRAGGHVRVDLIYEGLGLRRKAWIDLFGVLALLFPFCLLVAWFGVDFARESFELGESSGDPGGLPYRWIIKAVIPFAFFCTFISGLGMMLQAINTLAGHHQNDDYSPTQH